MSSQILRRGRIRGVSLRRMAAGGPRAAHRDQGAEASALSPLSFREAAPDPLAPQRICKLLAEHGRNEIHTLVSDCIEEIGQWRDALRALEARAPRSGDALRGRGAGEAGIIEARVDALVELRALVRKLEHRLAMLEWINEAQRSLARWDPRRSKAKGAREGDPGTPRRQG